MGGRLIIELRILYIRVTFIHERLVSRFFHFIYSFFDFLQIVMGILPIVVALVAVACVAIVTKREGPTESNA